MNGSGGGASGGATDHERQLREITAQLEEARHELESLAYSISHDLRAPLRSIFGFTNLLVRKYGESLNGQARDYLDRIASGTARMDAMIEAILKLSRIGRVEIRRETVDLSAVARSVIADLTSADPERKVGVDVEPGLMCEGDATLLRTVVQNLLHNAWKFTGGIESPFVRVFSRSVAGQRYFCVTDNGAGFTMTQVHRLFNPFQRLHLETEFPGIGMGLALVKKIVLRHDGTIFAEGEEGKGATVCFTIGENDA